MNVRVINKTKVKDEVLDALAAKLPGIISGVLEIPGGKVAILKPEDISIEFSGASARDAGADIRIMIFAKSNDPRKSTENSLAKEILEQVVALIGKSGAKHSIDIRIYLTEIGVANHSARN